MSEHLYIPDCQVKPDVPLDHLTAIANYAVEKQPNVIICAGDFWDMKSLSSYDRGTKNAEGARYQDDIDAGNEAMEVLMKPINDYNKGRRKKYKPRKIITCGNHEERILRHVNANPELAGKLSYADFNTEGWEWHDFLEIVTIDGVAYSHYFHPVNSPKAYGGRAPNVLNNVGYSFTMGHRPGKDLAEKALSNGRVLRGVIAGSYYMHEENYKGPQGKNHWRGCIYKHEVKDGNYDIMELSLGYLLREWF